MITVITAAQDFHALAIQAHVRHLGYAQCHVVEIDNMSARHSMSIAMSHGGRVESAALTSEGERIEPARSRLNWLRRIRANQLGTTFAADPTTKELVDNECRGAASGLLSVALGGKWISPPDATFNASDKIYQLKTAAENGFRIPRTLVTQSRDEVTRFFDECNGRVIVKPIVGVAEPFLTVKALEDPLAYAPEAFSAAPATYQELIEGTRHLRMLSFGQNTLCGLIDSRAIDWRPDLRVPIVSYDVDEGLAKRVQQTLRALGLEMGIVDIKLTPDGEPVWFEVNPQGQFLFLQPLINVDLIDAFSRYLIEEASGPT